MSKTPLVDKRAFSVDGFGGAKRVDVVLAEDARRLEEALHMAEGALEFIVAIQDSPAHAEYVGDCEICEAKAALAAIDQLRKEMG